MHHSVMDKPSDLFYNSAGGEDAPPSIQWADKKTHGAGVTAILPLENIHQEDIAVTGSYDDHIRLIHAPLTGKRTVLADLDLGGGVWRLKRLARVPSDEKPDDANVVATLLASCMHAGARVLNVTKEPNAEWRLQIIAKFEEHKSMNYGSDCQPFLTADGQRTFVTTSFYDRLLCLWRY
jgi:diphthamide biosynthesis protein 7